MRRFNVQPWSSPENVRAVLMALTRTGGFEQARKWRQRLLDLKAPLDDRQAAAILDL
jgi:hypothetical protein